MPFDLGIESICDGPAMIALFNCTLNLILHENQIVLPNTGLKIVDLGCGSGGLTRHYSEKRHLAIGIDISQDLIANYWKNTRNVVGDIQCLPIRKGSIDLVLSSSIKDYSRNPQELGLDVTLNFDVLASEIARILKRGGIYYGGFEGKNFNPETFGKHGLIQLPSEFDENSGVYRKV